MKSNGQKCAVDEKAEICSDENLSILCLSFSIASYKFTMFSSPTVQDTLIFPFQSVCIWKVSIHWNFQSSCLFLALLCSSIYIFDTNYDNLGYLLFLVVSKIHHVLLTYSFVKGRWWDIHYNYLFSI